MVACMALLSGCTESTIVKPTSETVVGDPNFETQENVEIDWTQVSTDAEDMIQGYKYLRVRPRFPFLYGAEQETDHADLGSGR